MAKVRLGPFSKIQVSLLEQKLEKEGIRCERFEDLDLLREFARNAGRQKSTTNPTYAGGAEYILLEVEREHLLLIKQDLDDMGFPLVKPTPPPEGEDYFCPACKYSSSVAGTCPTHNLKLLDFSGWKESKSEKAGKRMRWLTRAALLICLFLLGASLRTCFDSKQPFEIFSRSPKVDAE